MYCDYIMDFSNASLKNPCTKLQFTMLAEEEMKSIVKDIAAYYGHIIRTANIKIKDISHGYTRGNFRAFRPGDFGFRAVIVIPLWCFGECLDYTRTYIHHEFIHWLGYNGHGENFKAAEREGLKAIWNIDVKHSRAYVKELSRNGETLYKRRKS